MYCIPLLLKIKQAYIPHYCADNIILQVRSQQLVLTLAGESLQYFQKLLKLFNKQLLANKEIDPEDLKVVMKSEEVIPFVQLLQNINIIQQVLFCGEI